MASWAPAVAAGLGRKLDNIVWVGIGADADTLARYVPEARAAVLSMAQLEDPEQAGTLLGEHLSHPSDRIVFFLGPHAAMPTLQLLHALEVLRDRTRAVVLQAPNLDGTWLEEHFNHDQMDTELGIPVSYIVVPAQERRALPVPPKSAHGAVGIDVVNLDPPTVDDQQAVHRALLVLLAHKAREW